MTIMHAVRPTIEEWPVLTERPRYPPGLVKLAGPYQLASGQWVNEYYRRSRERLLLHNRKRSLWRQRLLAWLRDNVHQEIPRLYYELVLGHDLHISTYAELYLRHLHATEPDPVEPWRIGWVENVGLVCRRKVTTAFRDEEVDALQGTATPYANYDDFKFHRPGTSSQAESNTDTALISDAGLEATGTQVEGASADIYKSVATVTADATETWQEHGIFNVTGLGANYVLMDRNLISPTVSVVASDTCEFTFQLTKNAEA